MNKIKENSKKYGGQEPQTANVRREIAGLAL